MAINVRPRSPLESLNVSRKTRRLRARAVSIVSRYIYQERRHTIDEICRMMGISKSTLYNYLAEANAGAGRAA